MQLRTKMNKRWKYSHLPDSCKVHLPSSNLSRVLIVYLNLAIALGLKNCYIVLLRGQGTIVFVIVV